MSGTDNALLTVRHIAMAFFFTPIIILRRLKVCLGASTIQQHEKVVFNHYGNLTFKVVSSATHNNYELR